VKRCWWDEEELSKSLFLPRSMSIEPCLIFPVNPKEVAH